MPSEAFTLQDAIRQCRGTRSQEEAARHLGRTQTWWSYVENGQREPNVEDLRRLSEVYGLRLFRGEWGVA